MKSISWFVSVMLALLVAGLVFVHFSPDYGMYVISSESMKPAINMGDGIVTGPLGGPFNGEVKPGTVVTYERGKHLVTHRVLSIDGDTLIAKGDAVEDPDPRLVSASDIAGVYLFKVPYVGYLANFTGTKLGWLLVIIVPAMLLVALLIRDIVREATSSA